MFKNSKYEEVTGKGKKQKKRKIYITLYKEYLHLYANYKLRLVDVYQKI